MKPQPLGVRALISPSCTFSQLTLFSQFQTLTQALLASNPQSTCTRCRNNLSRRQYSAAATAATPDPSTQSIDSTVSSSTTPPIADTRTQTRPQYQIRAGVVLSRPPVITRDLHPFEQAFFLYQRRLNERTAMPFSRYFYIKRGTPADVEWKRKIKERLTPARDIGTYNAYAKDGWNDEVLVGAKEGNPEHQMEVLLRDAEEPGPSADGESAKGADESSSSRKMAVEKPQSRITEADVEGDQQSLNRMLQRTLYLLVKNEQGKWEFPSSRLVGREGLNKVCAHTIDEQDGRLTSVIGCGASHL